MQKPLLYVRQITNLSDARYCAGMGVDMLGFVVDPAHEDYVSADHYQQMIGWISGPKRVIEITENMKALPDDLIGQYKPDLIHVSLSHASTLSLPEIPLILEMSMDEFNSYSTTGVRHVEHLLIRNVPANVSLSRRGNSILLSVGKEQNSVIELLEKTGAQGIALKGTAELAPGLKDYDHLSRILEELE